MVSPMTHKNHMKYIIFNATMFHEVIEEKKKKKKKQTALINQRAVPLVKSKISEKK